MNVNQLAVYHEINRITLYIVVVFHTFIIILYFYWEIINVFLIDLQIQEFIAIANSL